MKRFLCFLLAVGLVAAVFSGCQPAAPASGDSSPAGTPDGTGTGDAGERVTLTLLTNVNVDTEGYDVNDSPYVLFLEEQFNVDLDIISEASKYQEKVNTVMASGNLPDFLMLNNKEALSKWASEEMLMDITELVPSYSNLSEQISELGWNVCKYEGRIYGVPLLRYDQTPLVTFANKGYLDALGIDPDEVRTIDDWYDMLYQLTYGDPDGNGIDDTLGMLSSEDDNTATTVSLLDAFDGATMKYIDGELLPYYLTPGYKDYLKFMNRLYTDGILDPEYVVTTSNQKWDKIVAGNFGTFLWFWMTTELRTKDYDLDNLVALAPPLREDGTQSGYRYPSPVRTYTAITKDCQYPEKVLEILDWGCSEEGGVFVFAGIEGLDYERNGDGITIHEDRRGLNTSLRFILLGTQRPNIDTPLLESLLVQAFGETSLEFLRKADEYGLHDELELIAPYFPELAIYDLQPPMKEFRNNAIMGVVDIDAEWDNYVARYRNAGGDEQIRLLTEWYENEYLSENS